MKTLVIVLASLVLAQAGYFDDVDWSTVKRNDILVPIAGYDDVEVGERIVGGIEAVPHSIPFQCILLIQRSDELSYCGGSLISSNFVLTAAHCLNGTVSAIEVRLGAHYFNDTSEPTQVQIPAAAWIFHENFTAPPLENDIGIVALATPAPINTAIDIVKLPTRTQAAQTFVGNPANASGWGLVSSSATTLSPVLRVVTLNVISNFLCNLTYPLQIKDTQLCTSGFFAKGICSGDSGGPLYHTGQQILIGIVSFFSSLGCEFSVPSGFTRVGSYLDWIQNHTDVIILP